MALGLYVRKIEIIKNDELVEIAIDEIKKITEKIILKVGGTEDVRQQKILLS